MPEALLSRFELICQIETPQPFLKTPTQFPNGILIDFDEAVTFGGRQRDW